MYEILLYEEGLRMAMDEKIKTSDELEFAVFCIENVAAKLVRDGVSDMHCMSDAYWNRSTRRKMPNIDRNYGFFENRTACFEESDASRCGHHV